MLPAAVVIPTWQGLLRLRECLDALDRCSPRPARVVVVDDGSTDGTCAWLREHRPDVEVVALPTNRGFAAAVNAGVARCAEPWVAVLNNDVRVEPSWLAALLEVGEAHDAAGAVGSCLLQARDPGLVDSAGIAWSVARGGRDLLRGQPAPPEHAPPIALAMVNAGACLYRRQALAEVGGFEETFVAYVEDVDLGLRLRAAGWDAWCAPAARGLHDGGATLGHFSARHLELLCRNHYATLVRNVPAGLLLRNAHLILRDVLARILRDAVHGHPRAPWKGLLRLLRDAGQLRAQRRAVRSRRTLPDGAWEDLLVELSRAERQTRPRANRSR